MPIERQAPSFWLLSESQITEAQELSNQTLRRFESLPGHYRNTNNSHFVGKLGEIAAQNWIDQNRGPCDPIFRDEYQQQSCDITFGKSRIEVKTWNRSFWEKWGRCIAVNQLPALEKKADVIIWCTVSIPPRTPAKVQLVGWSTLTDVSNSPIRWTGSEGRKVKNHQIYQNEIRPLASFLSKERQEIAKQWNQ